jgi:hypothetical protein
MNNKYIFFIFLFFIIGWILFFGLNFRNIFLVFDFKNPTPVSPIYYVKRGREQIQSLFIMGNRDSADWNFNLAKKRIIESDKLCNNKLVKLGKKHLSLARNNYSRGVFHLNYLIDVVDTNYLMQEEKNIEDLLKRTCK